MRRDHHENICIGEYGIVFEEVVIDRDEDDSRIVGDYCEELYESDRRDHDMAVLLQTVSPEGRKVLDNIESLIATKQHEVGVDELSGRRERAKRTKERLARVLASKAYVAFMNGAFTREEFSVVRERLILPYQPKPYVEQIDQSTEQVDSRLYSDVKLRAANDDTLF